MHPAAAMQNVLPGGPGLTEINSTDVGWLGKATSESCCSSY